MKKIFFTFFILYAGIQGSFCQTIFLEFVEKKSGEPIIDGYSFIIEPVNGTVIGYSTPDIDGNCSFILTKPLLSGQFQVRLYNLHLKDTVLTFNYNPGEKYKVEWEVCPSLQWFTIYYNEKGITEYKNELGINENMYVYYSAYYDTLNAGYERENIKKEEEYKNELQLYWKRKAWADSINSLNPQVRAEYMAMPVEPVYPVYYAPPASVIFAPEKGEYPGGDDVFLKKLIDLKTLKPVLSQHKNFRLEFRLHGFEFMADTVIAYDYRNKVMKKNAKIWNEMKPLMQTRWKPMTAFMRPIRLRRDVIYTIEFIYREE